MATKYVINNHLTENALLTTDLIKKCTFNVGGPVPVRINEQEQGQAKTSGPKRQYYQKFIDVSYPGGQKSATILIPNCVMHHSIQDYYGKPSIYVGIPQSFVREMSLKLSTTGNSPLFQDKKILSDDKYWWVRASFTAAEEGKEYIRVIAGDSEDQHEYYGSFADLFAEYPTSMIANITGTLKLKADTDANSTLKDNEVWRAGIQFSMFTPYDSIDITAPSTGVGQISMIGKSDKIKSGLLNKRVATKTE